MSDQACIRAYREDDAEAVYFARIYADERTSKAAWERASKKIRADDDVSVFRVQRPNNEWLVIVLTADERRAKRVYERVAWGGAPCELTDDEIRTVIARFVEVGDAGRLQSTMRWGAVGGIDATPEGTIGPRRRPQG